MRIAPPAVNHRSVAASVFIFFLWPSVDIHAKFYGGRLRETPQPGELNARGAAKYSDFGPIEGYILETAQDRR